MGHFLNTIISQILITANKHFVDMSCLNSICNIYSKCYKLANGGEIVRHGYWRYPLKRALANSNGITLTELVCVLTIIAILLGVAIPRYLDVTTQARLATDQANVRILNTASQDFLREKTSENSQEILFSTTLSDTEALLLLVSEGYIQYAPNPTLPGGRFTRDPSEKKWQLVLEENDSFYIISLTDGLTLGNAGMLGSWSGVFGEAQTYTGNLKDILIPAIFDGVTLKNIGRHVFREVGLVGIAFGEGSQIERIHTDAFHGNNLTTIDFPSTLTRIDMRAFRNNDLTVLNLPPSLSIIERQAFEGNSLNSITIGSNVTTIGENAFGQNTNQFIQAYTEGGAGTYIWNGENWVKQEN